MMIEAGIIQKLSEGLKQEAVHYRRLQQLSTEQKDLLVAGELEKLTENVRLSEKEVFALGPLTSKRTEILSAIARQTGMKEMALMSIVENSTEPQRSSLEEAVREVTLEAKRLDDLNRGCEKLLENAVGYVNFTLTALTEGVKTQTAQPVPAGRSQAPTSQAVSMLNRVV